MFLGNFQSQVFWCHLLVQVIKIDIGITFTLTSNSSYWSFLQLSYRFVLRFTLLFTPLRERCFKGRGQKGFRMIQPFLQDVLLLLIEINGLLGRGVLSAIRFFHWDQFIKITINLIYNSWTLRVVKITVHELFTSSQLCYSFIFQVVKFTSPQTHKSSN